MAKRGVKRLPGQKPANGLTMFIREQSRQMVWEQTRIRFQMSLDAACLAAHEVFGMGAGRSQRFVDAFNKYMNDLAELIGDDAKADPEIEYAKAKLDKVLEPIIGKEQFLSFDERYGAGVHFDRQKRIRKGNRLE